MKKTAGIYARLSGEDQSVYSLPSQLSACRALARERGFEIGEEFVDNGGLSTMLDREALTRLREAVRSGVIQVVIAHDLDRLSRKLSHQLLLAEEFTEAGVELHFVNGGRVDDTPEAKVFLSMRGAFSEFERARTGERTRRGCLERARQGKVLSGTPYGYLNRDGVLTPHPDHAPVVATIFRLAVEGRSTAEIARRLNEDSTPAPRGSLWLRASVAQILRRRAYTGAAAWNQSVRTEPERRRKPAKPGKDRRTSMRRRPASEWIPITIPAIVPAATFEAVQAALQANRRWKSGRPTQRFLLSGLIRCGVCHSAVCGSSGHGFSYYKCSGRNEQLRTRCKTRGVRLELIESNVRDQVWSAIREPKTLATAYNEHVRELNRKTADHEAERAALTGQLEKLARREYRARAGMLDADVSDSWNGFREDLKTTQAKRREIERRLEAIRPPERVAKPGDFAKFCDQMKALYLAGLTWEEERTMLRFFLGEITLSGDDITLAFSFDLAGALAALQGKSDGGNGNDGPGGIPRNCIQSVSSVCLDLAITCHSECSSPAR